MVSNKKKFFQCFHSIFNPFFATGCLSFRLNGQQKLEISTLTIILTNLGRFIGLGSFIAGWLCKVHSHQYSKSILALSPLMQFLGVVELLIAILTYVFVSIIMEFQKKMHVQLFNKAYELDKVLADKFNVSFNYDKEIRRNGLNMRILILYCGIYYTTCFISMDPDWRVVLLAFGYAVCTLGPLCSSYALFSLMDFLRIRFGLFRSILQNYISLEQKQQHLVLLFYQFRKYCELIHDVNNVYGNAILVNYLHDFTQTSCIVFVLCHMALESEAFTLEYLLLFMFVLSRMLKVVYMAVCARETINELKYCIQIIASYDDHCPTKDAKNIVDEFIKWNKLNTFHFYIGNAMRLDLGLVYAFFFGVANYVLILIQLKFQETSIKDRLGATFKKTIKT